MIRRIDSSSASLGRKLSVGLQIFKVISMQSLCVLKIFYFIRNIMLLVVPRVVPLLVRLQVGVAVSHFIDLVYA